MGMLTIAAGQVLDRIKSRCGLPDDADVGVFGMALKDTIVDESGANRDIVGVATSDGVDLDSEVVLPVGADTSYFDANGKRLFLDHRYDAGSVVGAVRYMRPYPDARAPRGLEFRARILSTPLGEEVLTIGKEIGWGASIGFQVLEASAPTDLERKSYPNAERIIRKWKLLELSLTALPANVACQASVASIDNAKAGAVAELVTKGRIKASTARALGVDFARRTIVVRRAVVVRG
jgi:hypothetical protein